MRTTGFAVELAQACGACMWCSTRAQLTWHNGARCPLEPQRERAAPCVTPGCGRLSWRADRRCATHEAAS